MTSKVRLVIVGDIVSFRPGLISLLRQMPEFQVVGEAGEGRAAMEVVRRQKPDVLLLDDDAPGMSGVGMVRALRNLPQREQCRVIMLSESRSAEDLLGAITAGADGYLLKNIEPEELRKAILHVHQGMSVLSPQVTRQVLNAAIHDDPDPMEAGGLSVREMEVLAYLAQGKTTTQIAAELYISENTVKTHVRHILEKLDASNRAEAVSKAIQMGLIKG